MFRCWRDALSFGHEILSGTMMANEAGDEAVVKRRDTGRDPGLEELREAERVSGLDRLQQQDHPSAVRADHGKLGHVNTHGTLPDFYIDQPFVCRTCGKRQIWKAADQKWFYEEAKGHVDARAVECHACRTAGKRGKAPGLPGRGAPEGSNA